MKKVFLLALFATTSVVSAQPQIIESETEGVVQTVTKLKDKHCVPMDSAVEGAATLAATGGTIGFILGPLGSVIGAAAGGLLGAVAGSSDVCKDQYRVIVLAADKTRYSLPPTIDTHQKDDKVKIVSFKDGSFEIQNDNIQKRQEAAKKK